MVVRDDGLMFALACTFAVRTAGDERACVSGQLHTCAHLKCGVRLCVARTGSRGVRARRMYVMCARVHTFEATPLVQRCSASPKFPSKKIQQ